MKKVLKIEDRHLPLYFLFESRNDLDKITKYFIENYTDQIFHKHEEDKNHLTLDYIRNCEDKEMQKKMHEKFEWIEKNNREIRFYNNNIDLLIKKLENNNSKGLFELYFQNIEFYKFEILTLTEIKD